MALRAPLRPSFAGTWRDRKGWIERHPKPTREIARGAFIATVAAGAARSAAAAAIATPAPKRSRRFIAARPTLRSADRTAASRAARRAGGQRNGRAKDIIGIVAPLGGGQP